QAFTRDLAGRLVRETYPEGSIVESLYTAGGNLASISLNGTLFASWSDYSPLGIPTSATYGNGVTTTYDLDMVGHGQALRTVKDAAVIQDLSYDWYTRANTGGLNLGSITDRRASKVVNGADTDETQTYAYDALYRLTQATGVWGAKTYAYDRMGNP